MLWQGWQIFVLDSHEEPMPPPLPPSPTPVHLFSFSCSFPHSGVDGPSSGKSWISHSIDNLRILQNNKYQYVTCLLLFLPFRSNICEMRNGHFWQMWQMCRILRAHLHQASASMLRWCLRFCSHWKQWSCSRIGLQPISKQLHWFQFQRALKHLASLSIHNYSILFFYFSITICFFFQLIMFMWFY